MEDGAVADEGDQVWCVDRAPAGLCSLDQLVGHRQAGCARSGSLGDLCSQTYCGESAFDRVRGAQVDPVLGGVSNNSSSTSASATILATALGYLAP